MAFRVILRPYEQDDEPRYPGDDVLQMARITLEMLQQCEEEELVRPRPLAGGGVGYSEQDVSHLARIRRLQQDLGLNMAGVEVVLHMRRQLIQLQQQMAEVQAEMRRQEAKWLRELQEMRRRAAVEGQWR